MTEKEKFAQRIQIKFDNGLQDYKPSLNYEAIAEHFGGTFDTLQWKIIYPKNVTEPSQEEYEEYIYSSLNIWEDECDRFDNLAEVDQIKEQLQHLYIDLKTALLSNNTNETYNAIDMALVTLSNWTTKETKEYFTPEKIKEIRYGN